MPGYISFTKHVNQTLRARWKTYLLLCVLLAMITFVVGGVTSQDTYNQISQLLKDSGGNLFGTGAIDKLGQAGLLFLATFVSGSNGISADQQVWIGFSGLFGWLTTVWLLREQLLSRRPRLRDGLYAAGSPIAATFVVACIIVLQLLPIGLLALVYSGLSSVGLVSDGFGSMLYWVSAATVGLMVLYWIVSSILALVIVTLPGMYPMRALRAAGDLVVGRRSRIVYRLLWAGLCVVCAWMIVVIPLVLLDTAISDAWQVFAQVPVLPFTVALMSAMTIVWFSGYVYLLYRRIVEDDAKPA